MNKFKRYLLLVLAVLLTVTGAYADSAKQVDFLLSGYTDPLTHKVLSGGEVWTYLDGTSTLAPVWTDKDKGGVSTNPVVLDSAGRAEIYGDNIYKFVIYDDSGGWIEEITGLEYQSSVDYTPAIQTKVTKIDTIDLLRAHTPYTGESAQVAGYYSKGDGGGGGFYWDPTNVSDDDDGIIFKVSLIETGRWVRIIETASVYPEWWGSNTDPGITNMAPSIQAAINYVATSETTEGIPVNPVKASVELRGGKYYVANTIIIGSYISLKGSYINATVLESDINTGAAIILVRSPVGPVVQQNYVSISNMTISGRASDNIGIHVQNTNRFNSSNVSVKACNNGALLLEESFINDFTEFSSWDCGDATHAGITLRGPALNFGPNATNFFGGEVFASPNIGMSIEQITHLNVFGMTLQSCGGDAINMTSGLSVNLNNNYFELNRTDIRLLSSVKTTISNSIFAAQAVVHTAPILINRMSAGSIYDNEFVASGIIIDDISEIGPLLFDQSHIYNNFGPPPLNISANILAVTQGISGSTIQRWEGNTYGRATWGPQQYKGLARFDEKVTFAKEVILNETSDITIQTGSISPEGAYGGGPGSMYLRTTGQVYKKATGTGATGWVEL